MVTKSLTDIAMRAENSVSTTTSKQKEKRPTTWGGTETEGEGNPGWDRWNSRRSGLLLHVGAERK